MAETPSNRQPELPGVPKVGEIVAGKYRVERIIGIGGMGVVVAARHEQLGQRVAIKFLLPDAAQSKEAVARFLREAQASAAIESDHVAKVLDVGSLPNGAPYLVMELLTGMDLAQVIHLHGARPIAEAVHYVLQACEAIATAHKSGVIHRDLKPSNLFLARKPDGSSIVKVLDFGISKMLGPAVDPQLTATSMSYGTPIYMSPEQVRSLKTVDARTDVWALGVILHELVSGRQPFAGDSLTALAAAIASDAPIPLRSHAPHAPEELERVVLRCLEKNVANRFQSVSELAVALAPLAAEPSRPIAERVLKIAAAPPSADVAPLLAPPIDPHALTASAWGRTRGLARNGKVLLVASSATIVVGAIAIVWLLTTSPRPSRTIEPVASAPVVAASVSAAPLASSAAPATSAAPAEPASAAPTTTAKKPTPKTHGSGRRGDDDALKERR